MENHWTKRLKELKACSESIEWAQNYESFAEAWKNCERGDWMLWLLAKKATDRRTLVLITCKCARTALEYIPEDEDRPRIAIETAEKWAREEKDVTLRQVMDAYAANAVYTAANAANAANAAANAANAAHTAYAAAAYAAHAAAYAAHAAHTAYAAHAANAAAYAASAAYTANAASAAYTAYAAAHAAANAAAKQHAIFVREFYPTITDLPWIL